MYNEMVYVNCYALTDNNIETEIKMVFGVRHFIFWFFEIALI